MKEKVVVAYKALFHKRGKFSITRSILIVTWWLVLWKFMLDGVTFDFSFYGYRFLWPIKWDFQSGLALVGAASSLYWGNFNAGKQENNNQCSCNNKNNQSNINQQPTIGPNYDN